MTKKADWTDYSASRFWMGGDAKGKESHSGAGKVEDSRALWIPRSCDVALGLGLKGWTAHMFISCGKLSGARGTISITRTRSSTRTC